jgi:hypothetical protein
MKKIICFIVFFQIVNHSFAQKKKKGICFGAQFAMNVPMLKPMTIQKCRLGLPTFSYAASIEKRFTINNSLNFSLEYSLNFARYLRNQNLLQKNNFSSALATKLYKPIFQQVNIFTGVGVNVLFGHNENFNYVMSNPDIINCFPSESTKPNESWTTPKKSRLNPFFLVGFEKTTQIFKKRLIYSLQYNFGFMPILKSTGIDANSINGSGEINTNGFRIGLKYKY